MSKQHYIIPIFVPHRGCPHDCVFCNQKKITGQLKDTTDVEVEEKINTYLNTIDKDNSVIEVAFYGGSFTAIPLSDQARLLSAAYKYVQSGLIHNIRVSTRPDCINEDILNNLKRYGVTIVELGVQSMDEDVLLKSRRGHTREAVINAVKLLKEFNFIVGVQQMVGLPSDTPSKSINTTKQLIALKPDIARIYPALVISNTYMEEMFLRNEYTPLELKEAVEICKDIMILFEKNEIDVIRIGLQPTENIIMGRDVIAGPFHPSMRQLVESLVYRDMLEYLINDMKCIRDSIEIIVNPRDMSDLLGQKKENIKYLNGKYKFNKISVVQREDIEMCSIVVQDVEKSRKMSKKYYYNILK